MLPPRPNAPTLHGFTLLELMMVVAVIVSLLGVAAPSIQGAMNASRLKDSADLVYNRIFEAQQLAITLGTQTELRLYQAPDLLDQDTALLPLRKIQLYVLRADPDGADAQETSDPASTAPTFVPTSAAEAVHPSVVISSQPTYTSLLSLGFQRDGSNGKALGGYLAFRFHPDGSTTLPQRQSQSWFLTLLERNIEDTRSKPKNFITLQIDPATGTLRRFQPGA